MVSIKEIKGKSKLKEFMNIAWDLYKDDPNFVPPLKFDFMKTLRGLDNPLFMSGSHAFFIAYDEDKPVGRICSGIDEDLNKKKNIKEGYICLFECVNNKEIAFKLFDAAIDYLKERGIDTVRGPVSPTSGDDYRGLLVKGFDGPPVLMNSYNPPYYQEFFEDYGFVKYLDLYAYYYDLKTLYMDRYKKIVEYAMKKYNFHVDAINFNKLDSEMVDIKTIIDEAMPEEWEDMTPPSLDEVKAEGRNLKFMADPDLIYIARYNDRPIGFAIALPDYNQVLKKLDGRLFPFGILKFLYYRRKINGLRLFVAFVVPDYRKKAVNGAIFYKTFEASVKKGYIYGEGSTIGETNVAMRRDVENTGGIQYRTYRLYKKEI